MLFQQRNLPPAGLLTLADVALFTDRHFDQTEYQLLRLAAYRELGYLWTEQQLRPAFPQWALLTLPDPARAKAFLKAVQPESRLVNFIITTGLEFGQSPAPLLGNIWRALPAYSTRSMSLDGRPLLAWTTG